MSFNLVKDIPIINNIDELKVWLKPVYVISNLLQSKEVYENEIKKIDNLLKASFDIFECRTFPVKFKFYNKDIEVHTLELRDFFINLILWKPFLELSDMNAINKDYIFKCKEEIPSIEDYINYKIILTLRTYQVKGTSVNYSLSDVLYELRMISFNYSIVMGLNFSLLTFIDMYNNNERVREIMETTFDENTQPYEIEEKLTALQNEEIEIYKNDPGNNLGLILSTGSGMKEKQFAEFTIAKGLLPSLEGVTIPKPIENSTLLKGLDRPSYLYIDATGARKSLVMNKKIMGNAGYFGKIVLLLARTLNMSIDKNDCGTQHLVEYEIKTKKHLNKLNGKFYKLNDDDFDFNLLNASKDKNLIGKKIRVRSAATCTLGNHVCPMCIGRTSITNFDIADGYSAFESEEVSKVINQSILSTKHLLTTISEKIEFNKEFDKFFTILGGEINPIVNENDFVENILDYAIYIDPEDIIKLEELDNDSLFNTCIHNGRFYIRNIHDKSEPDILIQADGEKEIFLSEEALELMRKGKGLIYFEDLDDDVKLFEMVIMNKELTKPLYELMDLLNKQRKGDNIEETIDSMSQKFLDLLIESKIDANIVAAELIINRLIRSVKDIYKRPDFSKSKLEPYEIFTVGSALEKNESPLIGLAYQNIKRQFLSEALYEDRESSSFIDPFFFINIPTDNVKEYARLAEIEEI